MEYSDEELIFRFKAGEKDSFEMLVKRYKSRVYNVVFNLVRDGHLAEDITQEVFIRMYRFLPYFKGKSKFYTWLYRLMVNLTLNTMKRVKRDGFFAHTPDLEGELDLVEKVRDESFSPQKIILNKELAKKIKQAVNSLSETLRATFILREFDDLSYAELAGVFGCSKGTIKSRIFRAREELRRKLSPYLGEGATDSSGGYKNDLQEAEK